SYIVEVQTDREIDWGGPKQLDPVQGYARKPDYENGSYQREIEGLLTIGRLIREGLVQPYTSTEIQFELLRGRMIDPTLNAFKGCEFAHCDSPVERSKFRSTIKIKEHCAKGGKKDKKKDLGQFTQIAFMKWLKNLSITEVAALISMQSELKLTSNEVSSLGDLDWFQHLAMRLQSDENLPDAFHLWTARRNEMDVFVTLDRKLNNSFDSIVSERQSGISFGLEVMSPLPFLKWCGVDSIDPIPIDHGVFYHYHELKCLDTKEDLTAGHERWWRRFKDFLFKQ
ncbi:MAG: hypothetical protein ACKVHP_03010, partial [Verrucomicrobiales bacterium]